MYIITFFFKCGAFKLSGGGEKALLLVYHYTHSATTLRSLINSLDKLALGFIGRKKT